MILILISYSLYTPTFESNPYAETGNPYGREIPKHANETANPEILTASAKALIDEASILFNRGVTIDLIQSPCLLFFWILEWFCAGVSLAATFLLLTWIANFPVEMKKGAGQVIL